MPRSFHDQYAENHWKKDSCLQNTHSNARNTALRCTDLFRTLFCCDHLWDHVGSALGAMCALGNVRQPAPGEIEIREMDSESERLDCGDAVAYAPCLCAAYVATLPCAGVRGALEQREFNALSPSAQQEKRMTGGDPVYRRLGGGS